MAIPAVPNVAPPASRSRRFSQGFFSQMIQPSIPGVARRAPSSPSPLERHIRRRETRSSGGSARKEPWARHSTTPSSRAMQTCQSPMVHTSSSFRSRLRLFQSGTKVVTQEETQPSSASSIPPACAFARQLPAMLTPAAECAPGRDKPP